MSTHPTPQEDSSSGSNNGSPDSASFSEKCKDLIPLVAARMRKKAEKTYERKPRHKTRPDKYEVKTDRMAKEKSGHEKTRHKSKRRCRRKTGKTLNHEFKAPNVPQDRLTLKPNNGPGFFHKGKASAPVERRGLPDLTFSEMSFLTKRREMEPIRYQKQKEIKPSLQVTNKGSSRKISGYFSQPGNRNAGLHVSAEMESSHFEGLTKSSTSAQGPPSAKCHSRKPLSMASDDVTRTRAESNQGNGIRDGKRVWVADCGTAGLERHKHVPSGPADSIASYYSWSATPSRQLYLPEALHKGIQKSTGQVDHILEKAEQIRPSDDWVLRITTSEQRSQSTISDRSLDQYTKHVLLGTDSERCVQLPHFAGPSGHYTLRDLKQLHRLSELHASDQISGPIASPHVDSNRPHTFGPHSACFDAETGSALRSASSTLRDRPVEVEIDNSGSFTRMDGNHTKKDGFFAPTQHCLFPISENKPNLADRKLHLDQRSAQQDITIKPIPVDWLLRSERHNSDCRNIEVSRAFAPKEAHIHDIPSQIRANSALDLSSCQLSGPTLLDKVQIGPTLLAGGDHRTMSHFVDHGQGIDIIGAANNLKQECSAHIDDPLAGLYVQGDYLALSQELAKPGLGIRHNFDGRDSSATGIDAIGLLEHQELVPDDIQPSFGEGEKRQDPEPDSELCAAPHSPANYDGAESCRRHTEHVAPDEDGWRHWRWETTSGVEGSEEQFTGFMMPHLLY